MLGIQLKTLKSKRKGVIMGRSVGGACIGFLVAMAGGIYIAFMIFRDLSGTMDHAEIIIALAIIIIPVLGIVGAIIGYFTVNTSK